MVAIGFSEREHNPISYKEFAVAGTIAGLAHLFIGTAYLLLIEFVGLLIIGGIVTVLSIIGFVLIMFPHLRGSRNDQKEK
jgi:phage shock protein PspC (stress-responsive transcriptional regulator)